MTIEDMPLEPQYSGAELRGLIIVARNQPDLWCALRKDLEMNDDVLVFLDRRVVDRRRQASGFQPNRRKMDRRRPLSSENDVRIRQYIIARPKERSITF